MTTTTIEREDPDIPREQLEDRYRGLMVSFEWDVETADFHEGNSDLWDTLDRTLGAIVAGVSRVDIHHEIREAIVERVRDAIHAQIIDELVATGIAANPS